MVGYKFSTNRDDGGILDEYLELVLNIMENVEQEGSLLQKSLSRFFLPVLMALLVIIALALIIPREFRKKILMNLLVFLTGLLFFLIMFYSNLSMGNSRESTAEMINTAIDRDSSFVDQGSDATEELPEPEIPRGISYVFSIVLVVLFLGTVYLIYRKIRLINKYNQRSDIKDITIEALKDIAAGGNYAHVILRCYNEMILTLQKEMGIVRNKSITPHEFQNHLIGEGLPKDDVEQLTSLFERVRYGNRVLNTDEEQKAEACLKSVITTLENR
ncbi:DUF4129 domain-containing protein [Methanococcoides sp. SA1]|nr:DUF4129 domain-containing protein [Methanococcoides sp. SA1]